MGGSLKCRSVPTKLSVRCCAAAKPTQPSRINTGKKICFMTRIIVVEFAMK
jgi:hypothetical protein